MGRGKHPFELQGHRGARGSKPENTLPSFEAAFDVGVSSVETDVHMSADGVPVLFHDDRLTDRLCRTVPGTQTPVDLHDKPYVSSITLAELRGLVVDRNPEPHRFPRQSSAVTPLSEMFAAEAGSALYAIPTLADLLAFAEAYAGNLGKKAGKTAAQRKRATAIRFDLELKRLPFAPETIGDDYTGASAGLLERKVVETVQAYAMVRRTRVRSFDHRAVRAVKILEPSLETAALIAGTMPVSPPAVARLARAEIYAPDFRYVDAAVVNLCHARRLKIMPWTVNDVKDWERLLAWGVDGITTDFPEQLAQWLRSQRVQII